jgi:hypothetical protein
LVVLKNVPWTEVIRNAPKVAEGAKKLWKTVSGKPAVPTVVVSRVNAAGSPASPSELQARVAALESAVADLHAQMLTSSEVVKALAEQNTQLVRRVEANRKRVAWLTTIAVVMAILALGGWISR